MTPERWEAVKDLFDRALALPAEERRPLLEASGDPELAVEVQRLIDQYEAAESFIETPPDLALELRGLDSPEYSAGDVLAGRFEIRRLLGRGGMGAVYEAVDREVVGERLALKTLPPSMVRD